MIETQSPLGVTVQGASAAEERIVPVAKELNPPDSGLYTDLERVFSTAVEAVAAYALMTLKENDVEVTKSSLDKEAAYTLGAIAENFGIEL